MTALGRTVHAPLVIFLVGSSPASAEEVWKSLLKCSVEFEARAEYLSNLGFASETHLKFLRQRADTLMHLSEARSAIPPDGACGEDRGLLQGLVFCGGEPSFITLRDELIVRRLTALATENKGNNRLPVCLEDPVCAGCLNLVGLTSDEP